MGRIRVLPIAWSDRAARRRIRNSSVAVFLSVCMFVGPEQVYALNQETSVAYAMSVAGVGSIPSPQVTYDYDDNGNLIERDDGTNQDTFVYDAQNRLISASINIGTTSTLSYAYDADGVRRSKTVNIVTTYHLTDKNRPYAQVIEEIDDMDVVQMRYLYGDDLISQTATPAGTPTTSYFHYDGQLSTRQLTDNNGTPSAVTVTDYYKYDAFGALTDSSGATSNKYLYTGEQYDSDLGQYYLRARYYLSGTGRFVSRDSLPAVPNDPDSIHRYLYGGGNPITHYDPSGLFAAAIDTLGASTIGAILQATLISVIKVAAFIVVDKLVDVIRKNSLFIHVRDRTLLRLVQLFNNGALRTPTSPPIFFSPVSLPIFDPIATLNNLFFQGGISALIRTGLYDSVTQLGINAILAGKGVSKDILRLVDPTLLKPSRQVSLISTVSVTSPLAPQYGGGIRVRFDAGFFARTVIKSVVTMPSELVRRGTYRWQ